MKEASASFFCKKVQSFYNFVIMDNSNKSERGIEMLKVNQEKNKAIEVEGQNYDRYAIQTHVVTDADDLNEVVNKYTKELIQEGDIVFLSEKMVACTQKRAIPLDQIHPTKLAIFLSKHVTKTKRGIGLGMPETMEMALRECGVLRILCASFVSIIGKLLGQRGWFYHVAGRKAAAIDGPCSYTLPPYNHYVVLGPINPEVIAKDCSLLIKASVAIVDINDYGAEILGCYPSELDKGLLVKILKDNPLGQSSQSTPIGIIRKSV